MLGGRAGERDRGQDRWPAGSSARIIIAAQMTTTEASTARDTKMTTAGLFIPDICMNQNLEAEPVDVGAERELNDTVAQLVDRGEQQARGRERERGSDQGNDQPGECAAERDRVAAQRRG